MSPSDAQATLEESAIIVLAGNCAERRARRPEDGWRRLTTLERVAIHEAGHICVAVALGKPTNGVIVDVSPTPTGGTMYRGIAGLNPRRDGPDHPNLDTFATLLSDFEVATNLGKMVVLLQNDTPAGWLAYLRSLWQRADAILDRHWLAVTMLAREVTDKRIVKRERAQHILNCWMPVKQHCLTEYLACQRPES